MAAAWARSPGTRMLMVGIGICFAFVFFIAWGEYSAWRSEVARVESEATNLAISFVQHAEDTVEIAAAPLSSMVTHLEFHGLAAVDMDELTQIMRELKSHADRVEDLFVFDEHGNWLTTTATNVPARANDADRSYFRAHVGSTNREPMVGAPILSRSDGTWIIPVSMRFEKPDGTLGGVVMAAIASRYFSDYYRAFATGEHSSALIVSGDGTVIARSPFDAKVLGTNIRDHDLLSHQLKVSDRGAYHYVSPIDGWSRIGGYYRSARSGLIVLTAVAESEALATWAKGARERWAAVAALVAIGATLGSVLMRQMRRQQKWDRLMAAKEAELRLLADHSTDLVERFDTEGIRRYVSPSAQVILGIAAEDLVGTDAYATVLEDDRAEVLTHVQRLREGERSVKIEFRANLTRPEPVWLETVLSALPRGENGEYGGVVAVTRDITMRKKMEAKLDEMAWLDGLTGIANRRAFDRRLGEEIARSRREDTAVSLVLIDVDRFKFYNDTYGHQSGDTCLKRVAGALETCLRRPGDMLARYGGEELVAILRNTDADGAQTIAENMRRAVEALAIPHDANLPWGHVTVSAGVATGLGGALSPEDLIQSADQELYDAKATGRNRVVTAPQIAA